jgi:transcription initiation factor TFIIA large subunit
MNIFSLSFTLIYVAGNQLHTVLTGPIIAATMALPQHLASSLLQQHVTAALQGQAASGASQMQQLATVGAAVAQNTTNNGNVMAGRQGFQQTTGTIRQLDGLHDTSDEDDDDDDDDDLDEDDENDDKDDDENEEENDGGPEEVCYLSFWHTNRENSCSLWVKNSLPANKQCL